MFLVDTVLEANPTMLPRISKADMDDKSKADYFMKSWLTIHTSWFCVQYLIRLILGYTICLLELTGSLYMCLLSILVVKVKAIRGFRAIAL